MTNLLKRGQKITPSFCIVRLIQIFSNGNNPVQVKFKVSASVKYRTRTMKVGKVKWDLHCCPLNKGCLLDSMGSAYYTTGLTVVHSKE